MKIWCKYKLTSNALALIDRSTSKRDHDKCKMTMGKESFGWHPMYFGVPKNSPYIHQFNIE